MKDCSTCKYGDEDERLSIPMCHHPKRFSEDCVDFNMYEEKEIKESGKPTQRGLDVTDFCKPIDPGIAQCIADHSWEMLGEEEKPVPNDFEEAVEDAICMAFGCDPAYYDNKAEFSVIELERLFIAGVEWGAEHAPLPEDTVIFNKGVEEGKRLMLEEAVECEVMDFSSSLEAHPHVNIPLDNKKYRSGDTVRLIVLPKEN